MRTNKPKVGDKLISSSDIIAEAKRLSASSAHDTNPFPIEAFSKRTRQFITSVYDHLRFKKDYLGINILCAIGVAAGKRYRIEINNTFHDYPGLFLCHGRLSFYRKDSSHAPYSQASVRLQS